MAHRTRSTGIAAVIGAPVLAAALLSGAGAATASMPHAASAAAPSATAEHATARAAIDVVPGGGGSFTGDEDWTISASQLAATLRESTDVPAGATVTCASALPVAEGTADRCVIRASGGSKTVYYAYAGYSLVQDQDYALYFSVGTPLSTSAADTLSGPDSQAIGYPVEGEDRSIPASKVLRGKAAVNAANEILANSSTPSIRVTSVHGAVDLKRSTPVTATAVDSSTGAALEVRLMGIPHDGEETAMLVSVPAGD